MSRDRLLGRTMRKPHFVWLLIALVPLACLAADSAPVKPEPSVLVQLNAVRARLVEHFALVQERCHCAGSLQARLDSELVRLSAVAGTREQTESGALVLAALESSLVDQLVAGKYAALDTIHESGSTLIRSKLDGSVQPMALFVPAQNDRQRNLPLVVMLHGADQSENELLSIPQLRRLAQTSGAIVALPWARGDDLKSSAAASDVYDALDATESMLSVDRRRVYLAGLSLGGIALFKIGPQHADRWTAFLAIAGTLTTDDMQDVVRGMRGKQIFMVAGGNDSFVKPSYIKAAAAWLAQNGIESHYYEQAGGDRTFLSLDPSLERAWRDMLSGVREITAPDIEMPSPQPTPSKKN